MHLANLFSKCFVSYFSGLRHDGGNNIQLYNDYNTKIPIGNKYCRLHQTYFAGKHSLNIKKLEQLLTDLVLETVREKQRDFVSLLILHLFSTFLFPTQSGQVNEAFIPYLENIENLNSYAWAFPVHETLMASLIQASKKLEENSSTDVNFYGCSTAVVVSTISHCVL